MRVVVSLTTIPSRVQYLGGILDCLHRQTYPIDAIYINLPYSSRREGKEYPPLPAGLNMKNVRVTRCDDLGPITKLAPTLDRERHPDTLIITVDDDMEYEVTRVEELVNWAQRFPGAAVAGSGKIVGQWHNCFGYVRNVSQPTAVSIIEGDYGCGYRRKFFSIDLLDYTGAPEGAFYNDDVWISGYLARRGIVRIVHPGASAPIHNRHLPNPLSGEWIQFLQRFLPAVQHFRDQGFFNEPQVMPAHRTVGFWVVLGILVLAASGGFAAYKLSGR